MKEIKAVIQPFRFDAVIDALRAHPELPGVTISDVIGFGKQRSVGTPDAHRALVGTQAFAKKKKIEIVVPDDAVEEVVELIAAAARTGNPGDGVIFVYDISGKRRIRDTVRPAHETPQQED